MAASKLNSDKRLSELSDAELKCRELHITDPYDQDGLIFEKPEDFEAVRGSLEIINTYSFDRYPAEKVKCIDCNSAKHGDGCTLQAQDGRKFLLGSDCGPRLLGRTWTDLKKVFGHKNEPEVPSRVARDPSASPASRHSNSVRMGGNRKISARRPEEVPHCYARAIRNARAARPW